jgi:hypothetical protein
MSCDGCMYNTKKAGCDYSYLCNTTGKPIRKITADDVKKESKRDRREQRVSLSVS